MGCYQLMLKAFFFVKGYLFELAHATVHCCRLNDIVPLVLEFPFHFANLSVIQEILRKKSGNIRAPTREKQTFSLLLISHSKFTR